MKITTVYSGPGYPIDPKLELRRMLRDIDTTYNCVMELPIDTHNFYSVRAPATNIPQIQAALDELINVVEICLEDPRIPAEAINLQRADQVHVRAKAFADEFFKDRENDSLVKRNHLRLIDEQNGQIL